MSIANNTTWTSVIGGAINDVDDGCIPLLFPTLCGELIGELNLTYNLIVIGTFTALHIIAVILHCLALYLLWKMPTKFAFQENQKFILVNISVNEFLQSLLRLVNMLLLSIKEPQPLRIVVVFQLLFAMNIFLMNFLIIDRVIFARLVMKYERLIRPQYFKCVVFACFICLTVIAGYFLIEIKKFNLKLIQTIVGWVTTAYIFEVAFAYGVMTCMVKLKTNKSIKSKQLKSFKAASLSILCFLLCFVLPYNVAYFFFEKIDVNVLLSLVILYPCGYIIDAIIYILVLPYCRKKILNIMRKCRHDGKHAEAEEETQNLQLTEI